MVLCKYFQAGNCRFGSKCVNEHFDVKQIIRTDVESAIKGKQWPFSCYGPFKDKCCIPNFIEDKSFEEVRYMCYEAKQKNYFPQFHQQLTKEAVNAMEKMKALLQMTPQMVEIVTQMFDSPGESNGNAMAKSNNNPFGFGGQSVTPQSAPLFNKTTTVPAAQQQQGSSVFGGGGNFGNSLGGTNSIFGGTLITQQQQQQQQQQQLQLQQNNIFANANNNNLFAQSLQNQQQPSIFGQQQQPHPQQTNIFGGGLQTSVFNQPAPTASGNGIFAHTAQLANNGGNIFAKAVQQVQSSAQQQAPTNNGFGYFAQQPMQQQPSPFGQQNVFGQVVNPQSVQQLQHQNVGFFGPTNQQQQQPNSGNIFSQPLVPNQMVYGQDMQQIQQTPEAGFFQQPMQMQQQMMAPPTQQFPSQNMFQANQLANSMVYSKMENLTPAELEAFKAKVFLPGQLPCSPPPPSEAMN